MVNKIGGTSIEQIQNQEYQQEVHKLGQVQARRLEAFDHHDKIDQAGHWAKPDSGYKSALPQEQQASLHSLMNSMTPEEQARFITAGQEMNNGLLAATQGGMTVAGNEAQVVQVLTNGMTNSGLVQKTTNEAEMFNSCMTMAYSGSEEEVYGFAMKVKGNNEAKSTLREEMSMLQDELATWPDDGSTRSITYREAQPDGKGGYKFVEVTKTMTKGEAQALRDRMESTLSTISDMSQMDQVKLQDAMQKQAQILQLMSNISKMIHDTLKGIIQNMR